MFKCFREITEHDKSISRPSFDAQLLDLQSFALALSIHWMLCYQSAPGDVQGTRFCGHEKGASWEEIWHEIYASKRTHKYSKHDKDSWWHTNWLDRQAVSWCVRYVTWLQWMRETERQGGRLFQFSSGF